jgi:hypothetical protein
LLSVSLTLRRVVFAVALVVVLVLMLRPVQEVSSSNDKADHLLVFAFLAVLGLWAAVGTPGLVAGLTGYAVLTEVLQARATSDRHGDPVDVLADLLGVALGVLLVVGLRKARRASSDRARRPG